MNWRAFAAASIITAIISIIIIVCFSGCATFPIGGGGNPTVGNIPIPLPANQLWQAARQTNWLVTTSIIIIAFGAVAAFQGMWKGGMSAALFGCVTLFLSLATARFALWMAVFGLVGAIAVVAASILWKNKAIVEVIKGVQLSKGDFGHQWSNRKDAINESQKKVQSKPTRKLVQTIKTNLKLKEKL